MSKVTRIILLSLASGAVWAGIATVLGEPMHPIILGGVLLAPFIGLAAGLSSAIFPAEGRLGKALFSLVSLYTAAAIFGLGMGLYDLVTGQNSGDGWRRIPSAVVIQAAIATLWGLTFTGYFIVLWPLAYVNHAILAHAWEDRDPSDQTAGDR